MKKSKNKAQKNDKFSMNLGGRVGKPLTKEQREAGSDIDWSKIDPDFGKGKEVT